MASDFELSIAHEKGPRPQFFTPLLKLSVIWFASALIIATQGSAIGISRPLQRHLTIAIFVVTGLRSLLNMGTSQGLSWQFWLSALILPQVGIQILAIQPRLSSITPAQLVEDLTSFDDNVRALTVPGQASWTMPLPGRYVPAVRRSGIPAGRVFTPGGTRSEAIPALDPAIPGAAPEAAFPIELVKITRIENGWSVTLRNVDSDPIGDIRYRMTYHTADGKRVSNQWETSVIRDVLPPHETRTINIEDRAVPDAAAYASFTVIGWDVSSYAPIY